ncbi:MAG: lipase maturation factor family protein [Myxococcaceae bacterium]|nr:lipase maturation factor family protein [Myxococcaceae bacterium]
MFLRALGAIFVIAFVSFAVQVKGLIGQQGILPAAPWLAAARAERSVWGLMLELPTVFWFGASDAALIAVCALGAVFGALVMAGIAPRVSLVGAWALYLSLVNVGMPFMAYQWDMLLLESGLLGALLAPSGLWPEWRGSVPAPPRWAVVLFWLLLFKLMVLSGLVKLLSGDPTWRNFTALEYHYWTQPLPSWTSWWANRLPAWVQRACVAAMFALELGAPFLVFAGVRGRRFAAAGMALLQLTILVTGNYGYFNYLTASLAILWVDDAVWTRVLPRSIVAPLGGGDLQAVRRARWRRELGLAVGMVLGLLSGAQMVWRLWPGGAPAVAEAVDRVFAPFRSINDYGLFAVMTTTRPEIHIEGTRDGRHWEPYAFRWKPGDPARAPTFVAPHQPRLDWQMWFAALGGDCRAPGNRWYLAFIRRLLEADPEVLGLMERDPFQGERPQRIRSTLYQYRFATAEERAADGVVWVRRKERTFCPDLALRGGSLVPSKP